MTLDDLGYCFAVVVVLAFALAILWLCVRGPKVRR